MTTRYDSVRTFLMVMMVVTWSLVALVLPVAGIPLAAYALAALVSAGRKRSAVAAAVVAVAVTTLLSPPSVLFVAPALVAGGLASVWAVRRFPAVWVVMGLAAILFVASVGSDAMALALRGESLVSEAQRVADEVARALTGMAGQMDPASTRTTAAEVQSLSQLAFMLWPSSYFQMAAITALLAVMTVIRAALSRGLDVNKLPRLDAVDITVHVVWFVAGALLLVAAADLLGDARWVALAVAGNVLLVIRLPLLVQGMGVVTSAFEKVGIGRLGRAVGYGILLVLDTLFYVITAVGLADLWVNFRRLPRGQGGDVAGTGSG